MPPSDSRGHYIREAIRLADMLDAKQYELQKKHSALSGVALPGPPTSTVFDNMVQAKEYCEHKAKQIADLEERIAALDVDGKKYLDEILQICYGVGVMANTTRSEPVPALDNKDGIRSWDDTL